MVFILEYNISYTRLYDVIDNDDCVYVNKRLVSFVIDSPAKMAYLSPKHIGESKL